jgi:ABC-2 type transport system permease protein
MIPLTGRPGSALWLLSHELRLAWRRGKAQGKRGLTTLLFVGALAAAWLVFSYIVFRPIAASLPPPPLGVDKADGVALLVISIALGFMATLMISQAIQRAIEAIYVRNDLDLLLSSPLSGWTVLIVRSTGIAVSLMPLYLGLLLPPIIWLSIFNSPLWLGAIPSLFATAFISAGFALLLVTALFRLLGPKNTRVIAQVMSLLIGAGVFLAFQLPNLTNRYSGRGGNDEERWIAWFNNLQIDATAPWFLPARALTGDLLAALIMIGLALLLFPLGVWVFSQRYVADAAAASTMGATRRKGDTRVRAVQGGLNRSIIRKEMRLIFRDPVLISRIGLQIVYLVPLAFILVRPEEPGGMFQAAAFAPVLTLLASSLAGSLAWITISAEDVPDLIAAAPVSKPAIERGKIAAAILPVLALMTVPVTALAFHSIVPAIWALAGILAGVLSAATIQIWRQTPGSRRDFMRKRAQGSVVAQMGQSFVALLISTAAGLGAWGLPWLAIIPAILALAIFGALHRAAEAS